MAGAPAPEHIGPSVQTIPNIVDVAGLSHSSTSTISHCTISRRQACLVECGPRLEQPSLEACDTPIDVILEQWSASQKPSGKLQKVLLGLWLSMMNLW